MIANSPYYIANIGLHRDFKILTISEEIKKGAATWDYWVNPTHSNLFTLISPESPQQICCINNASWLRTKSACATGRIPHMPLEN